MTEDWRKRLDATLDATVEARIRTAADANDAGKRRARFLRQWRAALGTTVEPALTDAAEPWLQRGLEWSLTVSGSPRSATLSVTIDPLEALHLAVHRRSRPAACGGVSDIRPPRHRKGAGRRSRYQRDHQGAGPGLHRRLHAPPNFLISSIGDRERGGDNSRLWLGR